MKYSAVALALAGAVEAHVGAFTDGMFCRGGNDPNVDDQNTNLVVNPLYELPISEWWMQADRGCDKVPPPEGEFLELPAGGEFTAELAINRAFTTLSYNGENVSDWPDGLDHPEDWSSPDANSCLLDNPDGAGGPLHTKNETTSAGTAWAISYESDLSKVTMENLVVFSVLEHTPWKRLATYEVPADLPACPEGGCYCAWLWVPDGCGEPNMYMQNFKCNVTNTASTKKLATAQIPVPCRDDPSSCVSGAKQMIAWHQAEGNNVGEVRFSPGYNQDLGFQPGAQNDIFVDGEEEQQVEEPAAPETTLETTPEVAPEAPTPSPVSNTQPAPEVPSETAAPGDDCKAKRLRRRRARALRRASHN